MTAFPTFIAATAQAAPVFMDTDATIDKACDLVRQAAEGGASLLALPEVFVPGYPYWNWTHNPVEGGKRFAELFTAAIHADGPEVAKLRDACRRHGVFLVIGINERHPQSMGTLYNSVLFIGDQGELLGVHRKLVPTWAEKLSWGNGDGSSLKVYDTRIGKLGALACGENTNTLARFSLLAQGEQVHVANYIALPTAPPDYDMVEAIKVRAAAHSFEGKVHSIVSCAAITPEIIDNVAGDDKAARTMLERKRSAFSGIFGPDGRLITEELIDEEGMRFAEIDIASQIPQKQMHDIIGHYNRFDVFQLNVDRTPRLPVSLDDPQNFRAPGRDDADEDSTKE
ncbi:carbon-nitrogen hydrolase family protein [Enemella sp. A6]|uniref:carbon-nitrogen hydrolase family protein n=1 Tax=Enemella sp. A6 TaxID=3440152 RepID=UPI003EBB0186